MVTPWYYTTGLFDHIAYDWFFIASNLLLVMFSAILKARVAGVEQPEYIASEWKEAAEYAEQVVKSFSDNRSMAGTSGPSSPINGNSVKESTSRKSPNNWVLDKTVLACMECQEVFTMFFRRHHCRRCGRMVCANCAPANNVRPIPEWGFTESVRHCKMCYKSPTLEWKTK